MENKNRQLRSPSKMEDSQLRNVLNEFMGNGETTVTTLKVDGMDKLKEAVKDTKKLDKAITQLSKKLLRLPNGLDIDILYDDDKIDKKIINRITDIKKNIDYNLEKVFSFPDSKKTIKSLRATSGALHPLSESSSVALFNIMDSFRQSGGTNIVEMQKTISDMIQIEEHIDRLSKKIAKKPSDLYDINAVVSYADALKDIIRATKVWVDLQDQVKKANHGDVSFANFNANIPSMYEDFQSRFEAFKEDVIRDWYAQFVKLNGKFDAKRINGIVKSIDGPGKLKNIYNKNSASIEASRSGNRAADAAAYNEAVAKIYAVEVDKALNKIVDIIKSKEFKKENTSKDLMKEFSGYLTAYLSGGGESGKIDKLLKDNGIAGDVSYYLSKENNYLTEDISNGIKELVEARKSAADKLRELETKTRNAGFSEHELKLFSNIASRYKDELKDETKYVEVLSEAYEVLMKVRSGSEKEVRDLFTSKSKVAANIFKMLAKENKLSIRSNDEKKAALDYLVANRTSLPSNNSDVHKKNIVATNEDKKTSVNSNGANAPHVDTDKVKEQTDALNKLIDAQERAKSLGIDISGLVTPDGSEVKDINSVTEAINELIAAKERAADTKIGKPNTDIDTNIKQEEVKETTELFDNLGRSIDNALGQKINSTALKELGKIITLFHYSSAEFDEFDQNKMQTGILSQGAYFGFDSSTFSGQYGDILSEWYADVRRVFDIENDKLSTGEIDGFLEKYLTGATEEYLQEVREKMLSSGSKAMIEIEEISKNIGISIKELWSYFDIDALKGQHLYGKDMISVLDANRLFKVEAPNVEVADIEEIKNWIRFYEESVESWKESLKTPKDQEEADWFKKCLEEDKIELEKYKQKLLEVQSIAQQSTNSSDIGQQKELTKAIENANDKIEEQQKIASEQLEASPIIEEQKEVTQATKEAGKVKQEVAKKSEEASKKAIKAAEQQAEAEREVANEAKKSREIQEETVGNETKTKSVAAIEDEIKALQRLDNKLFETRTTIGKKSEEFEIEKNIAKNAINSEIADLSRLISKLTEVRESIKNKSEEFEKEKTTVSQVVSAEINELDKLIEKLKEVVRAIDQDDKFDFGVLRDALEKAIRNVSASPDISIDVAKIKTDIETAINNAAGKPIVQIEPVEIKAEIEKGVGLVDKKANIVATVSDIVYDKKFLPDLNAETDGQLSINPKEIDANKSPLIIDNIGINKAKLGAQIEDAISSSSGTPDVKIDKAKISNDIGSAIDGTTINPSVLTENITEQLKGTSANVNVRPLVDGPEFINEVESALKDFSVKIASDIEFDLVEKQKKPKASEEASTMAKSIAKELGVASKSVISEAALEIDNLLSGVNTNVSDLFDIFAKDSKAGNATVGYLSNQYGQMMNYIRSSKIKKDPTFGPEFGDDWQKVRKTIGSGVIGRNGVDIDAFIKDFNEVFKVNIEHGMNPADSLRNLFDFIDKFSINISDTIKSQWNANGRGLKWLNSAVFGPSERRYTLAQNQPKLKPIISSTTQTSQSGSTNSIPVNVPVNPVPTTLNSSAPITPSNPVQIPVPVNPISVPPEKPDDIIKQTGYSSEERWTEKRRLGYARTQVTVHSMDEDGNPTSEVRPADINYEKLESGLKDSIVKLYTIGLEMEKAFESGVTDLEKQRPELNKSYLNASKKYKKLNEELLEYLDDPDYALEAAPINDRIKEFREDLYLKSDLNKENKSVKDAELLIKKQEQDNAKLDALLRVVDKNYNSVINNKALSLNSQQRSDMLSKKEDIYEIINSLRDEMSNDNRTLTPDDVDKVMRSIMDMEQLGKSIQESIRLGRKSQAAKDSVQKQLNKFLAEIAEADNKYLHDITKPIKQGDLSNMKTDRGILENFIKSYSGRSYLSPQDLYDIIIKKNEYKNTAKNVQKDNYSANQLAAKSTDVQVEKLTTDIQVLLNTLRNSGAATSEFETQLSNLLKTINKTNNIDSGALKGLQEQFDILRYKSIKVKDDYEKNILPMYKGNLNIIQRLGDARSELNNLEAKQIEANKAKNGKDYSLQIVAKQKEIAELEKSAKNAYETIQRMFDPIGPGSKGVISKNQFDEATNKYDDSKTGSLESQTRKANAINAKAASDNAKKYKESLDIVEKLYIAQSKLNDLEARQTNAKNGEDYTADIKAQTAEVQKLKKEAQAARKEVVDLLRNKAISTDEFASFGQKYSSALKGGSQESQTRKDNAQRKKDYDAEAKAVKNMEDAVRNYISVYDELVKLSKKGVGQLEWIKAWEEFDKSIEKIKASYSDLKNLGYGYSDIKNIETKVRSDANFDSGFEVEFVFDYYLKKIDDFERKLGKSGKSASSVISDLRARLAEILSTFGDGTVSAPETLGKFNAFGNGLEEFFDDIRKVNARELNLSKINSSINEMLDDLSDPSKITTKLPEYAQKINEFYIAINDAFNSRTKYDNDGNLLPFTAEEYEDIIDDLGRIEERIKEFKKKISGYDYKNKNGEIVGDTVGTISDIDKLKKSLESYAKDLNYGDAVNVKVAASGDKVTMTFKDQDGIIKTLTGSWDKLTDSMRVSTSIQQKMNGGSSFLSRELSEIGRYITMTMDVGDVIMWLRSQLYKAIDTFKAYDASLTNVSYTMDLTREGLYNLGSDALDMAEDLALSVENAMGIYEIYANMNTTAQEIKDVATPTAILANISGNDTDTTSDQIQGVLQQFNMLEDEANNVADASMHVVDVLADISANVSIDNVKAIGIMADAVQAAGAEAYQAGLSFEQLAAISAKVSERTRDDGSSIGNALKTIIVRLSKVGKMPGYEDEVSNEELSNASKSLNEIGIQVYESNGEFRQLDVILGELSQKWDTLTDAQQANISYNVAATRQTSKFKNMLEAWASAMDLAEHATTAQNTALGNQEKYEASFNGRLQQLSTKMDKFWIELLNSNIVDAFIDLLTKLVDSFNALSDAVGPGTAGIIGLIAALMGIGKLKDIILFITDFGKMKNAFGKVFAHYGCESIAA